MRTGLKIYGAMALFISIFISSCNSGDLETDMDQWCECEKQAAEDELKKPECDELKVEIAKKYEFDPNAATVIRKKVLECGH